MAQTVSLPAPVGGWDTRNALPLMPVTNAIIMDNWFPEEREVRFRRGHASHATGMSGNVDTLFEYTALDGTEKLFAANGANIYDVTSSGAVGAAVRSSLSNAQWQQVQIGTSAGQFLLGVNGADTPFTYNGTTWANAGMTGPTIANLAWINLHQRRLWFGEKDSLSAWYLGVNAITGSATEFPMHGIASRGGYIMAMGTWTRDAGDGVDDVAVFVTSEGEAIVYNGIDPGTAADWQLVGVFRIGPPIGRRCIIKAGADLIIITRDGFVTASTILLAHRAQADQIALSAQINKSVNDAVRSGGSLFGWQPMLYPNGLQLIFNIPQSATEFHQYVFNTITNAPCRFTGMNARCWGLLDDNAYFGGTDGVVYKADSGPNDNAADINGDVLQAFNDFGQPLNKGFKMVEPIFTSNGDPFSALDLNLDYQVKRPSANPEVSATTSAKWGVGKWGSGTWGTDNQVFRGWRGVRGIGRAGALRVRVDTSTVRPSWIATHFIYEDAGLI